MKSPPKIEPGDWIEVGSISAVVTKLMPPNHHMSPHCEVVFDPSKPTNLNVRWNGSGWEFVQSGDFGGYADKYPRLRRYVMLLKEGR